MNLSKSFTIQPVILSGGSGTRLWPLSRECYPKQYIKLNSSSNFSCLQRTFQRLRVIDNIEDPIIICNEEQRFILAEQMREINIKPKAIILEPFGRNTAPAIIFSALKAKDKKKDPILLILSSDHEIEDSEEFKNAINTSLNPAKSGQLVTLGIIPTFPSTGYGYIETKKPIGNESNKYFPISKFIEKPSIEIARELVTNKSILWNSGIFIFKTSTILKEFKIHQPELLNICHESFSKSSNEFDFQRINANSFKKCPNISIDIAIMEKTMKGCVVPLRTSWSDIGSWSALWNIEKKNSDGNVIVGDIVINDVKNSYLRSEKSLLVGMGIENLIIVNTSDATLVASKKDTENIKLIVNELIKDGRSEAKLNRKMFRPWGYFVLIEKTQNWQVKKIVVNPGSSLSLQKHNYRSEHWIVLDGKAQIENNKSKLLLEKNQSTYIPIGAKHRLSNPGDLQLTIIEVQSGTYLGEDDIVRFEDNYGRDIK